MLDNPWLKQPNVEQPPLITHICNMELGNAECNRCNVTGGNWVMAMMMTMKMMITLMAIMMPALLKTIVSMPAPARTAMRILSYYNARCLRSLWMAPPSHLSQLCVCIKVA